MTSRDRQQELWLGVKILHRTAHELMYSQNVIHLIPLEPRHQYTTVLEKCPLSRVKEKEKQKLKGRNQLQVSVLPSQLLYGHLLARMSRLSVLNNYTFQKWRIPGVERFRTLLPNDISVRPEDFLKCLKWNKTYPVISSISWLNPLTQETNVSNEVRKKRSSRENSFNLEAFFSPHIKYVWIASPQPFRRIKH